MDTNLIKTIYFYLVMAGCVLTLSIGSYWFIRANLFRHVFTEADDSTYYSSPVRSKPGFYDCQYTLNLAPPVADKSGYVAEPQLTDEQSKECKMLLEEEAAKQKTMRYQNDMVSSILMILISSIVLGIHLKFVRAK